MKNILIIPCFNDNAHLEELLKSILSKIIKIDILVIDDGSIPEVSLNIKDNEVKLIRNDLNMGKGYSLKRGFDYAIKNGFSHAITLDADLQHNPKHIEEFIQVDPAVNIVIGKRSFNSEMPIHRRMSNKITSFLVSILAKRKVLDSQSGYRRYKLDSDSFKFCYENGFHFAKSERAC